MNFKDAINQIYFDITASTLRQYHTKGSLDISYNSVMYLELISCYTNCTVSSLAEKLQVSKSAITLKINELERLGLVSKTQSEKDKRVFYLSTTDIVEETTQEYDRHFDKAAHHIEKSYTKEQLLMFTEILEVFSKEYNEAK